MKRPRLAAFDRSCLGDESAAVIGVDEAGRGALAGPVVAAACLIDRSFYELPACRRIQPLIRDSKQLTPEQREEALLALERCRDRGGIRFSPGIGSVGEIADENILGATRLAMKRAIDSVLESAAFPQHAWQEMPENDLFFCEKQARDVRTRPVVLVDGKPLKPFFYPHTALVAGDARSFAIAAASIVAKVTRDRLMRELHQEFPAYGFERNKGYGTPLHVNALYQHGACSLHREKFLRKLIADGIGVNAGQELEIGI